MADPNNPWGNRGGKKPPEFDEWLQNITNKLLGKKKSKSPWGNGPDEPESKSFNFIPLILLAIVVIFGAKSVYQVQPGEQGVVLRFGQFHETTGPGLNFVIPLVEQVIKVDVENIRKEEFGFRQNTTGSGRAGSALDLESLMLTSDFNVIQIGWVVQYKIRDPENFLFNIEDPRAAIRDVSESVLRRIVGNRDFNYVLNNREEVGNSTKVEMQQVLEKYNSGIMLVVVQLQDVNPPDSVRPSFNEVNEAEQDKIRLGNEAQKERNEKVPKAEGVAKQMIDEAKGYAIERVNKAQGDVVRFNAILKEYRQAKEVTRTRIYLETLREVLPNVQEVIVVDQSSKGMMPLVNIGAAASTVRPQKPSSGVTATANQ